MTETGIIMKALSGFYYVLSGGETVTCRARGRFRHQHLTPLVGDRVEFTRQPDGSGAVDALLPRKNEFIRPAVSNIDQLVIIASGAIPVTDPFLIDRVAAIADSKEGCDCVICINKCDLAPADELFDIYTAAGFPTLRVSAQSGEGMSALADIIAGKVSAFTGNSGVGKSSILNRLAPEYDIAVGEVSHKLGRGRHTTRHIELFPLKNGAIVADTPGFSSFDTERMELMRKEDMEGAFREFRPFLRGCQYTGCAHVKEKGCTVLKAVTEGIIPVSRHESYVRLYEQAKEIKDWERPKN